MADLTTSYLGLNLENPIVVASSPLSASIDKVVACEQAGVGAVVLKSLFEEQIAADVGGMMEGMEATAYAEAYDYIQGSGENFYIDKYLELIEESKKRVSVPVIASLNCVTAGNWTDYAKRIENVGADALELNVFIMPANVRSDARDIEKTYIDILRKIKKKITIPVAMKIGPHFSGLARMIKELANEGAEGLVLFNRFYRPDVNINTMTLPDTGVITSIPFFFNADAIWGEMNPASMAVAPMPIAMAIILIPEPASVDGGGPATASNDMSVVSMTSR